MDREATEQERPCGVPARGGHQTRRRRSAGPRHHQPCAQLARCGRADVTPESGPWYIKNAIRFVESDLKVLFSPQEVSCYIDYNVSMSAQNLWRVDIANREQVGDIWHTIQSQVSVSFKVGCFSVASASSSPRFTFQVRLIHVNSSQALKFSGRQLPEWGFNQHEVVTDRILNQPDSIWNVEEHRYTKSEYLAF